MSAISNQQKYQCALLKSSRKHYENAIEAYNGGRSVHGHATAATETADNAGDAELAGWLMTFGTSLESKAPDTATASSIVARYNEYNAACNWGLPDFDPGDPLLVPGDDDSGME